MDRAEIFLFVPHACCDILGPTTYISIERISIKVLEPNLFALYYFLYLGSKSKGHCTTHRLLRLRRPWSQSTEYSWRELPPCLRLI